MFTHLKFLVITFFFVFVYLCCDSLTLSCYSLISCRVLTELVSKMKDMQMDKTELGCLRAIVLFNPGQFGSLSPLHNLLESNISNASQM